MPRRLSGQSSGALPRKPVVTPGSGLEPLLRRLASLSEGPQFSADLAVQALLFRVDHLAQVREQLGSLPPLVEAHLAEIRMHEGTKAETVAVLWEHWPGGRQAVRGLRAFDQVQLLYAQELYRQAAFRGLSVRLAAFPRDGWLDALHEAQELQARPAALVREAMDRTPPPRRAEVSGRLLLTVPKLADLRTLAATAGHLLRLLDALAATPQSLQKNRGRLYLSFDGYDADARELWDIPLPRNLLRTLSREAPWWPLLVAPVQVYVWLAPRLSKAPTLVHPDTRQVGFPVDEAEVDALLSQLVMACTEATFFAGFEPESEEELALLTGSCLGMVSDALSLAQARYNELQRDGRASS